MTKNELKIKVEIAKSKNVDCDLTEKLAKRIASDIIIKISPETKGSIELMLTTAGKIAEINQKFRGKNEPTDVLSFPLEQLDGAKENIIGTIIICPEIAKQKNETCEELLQHGIIHLLGYDHETDEEEWNSATSKIKYQKSPQGKLAQKNDR
ncbi:MAG: rRNA maturation RNase YbeY [Candidatus Berkelbacteria bacterium]|nr:rRNA maturation RNase YbeY [Candidatus Berkelbacteria bacterium]